MKKILEGLQEEIEGLEKRVSVVETDIEKLRLEFPEAIFIMSNFIKVVRDP